MFPPGPSGYLDIEALSGICGSVSIACWVVVFSPQIIENFRRKSADGLSLLFLIIWLAGDVFNILGAVLQGVLPTMIILAVYYTLADIVLLSQCLYYQGFISSGKLKNGQSEEEEEETEEGAQPGIPTAGIPESSERTALLRRDSQPGHQRYDGQHQRMRTDRRRSSLASISSSLREHVAHIDGTHLSPATPFVEAPKPSSISRPRLRPASTLQIVAFNSFAVTLVCAAGVLGWYISVRYKPDSRYKKEPAQPDSLVFDIPGQVFGYLCAALYLGSRVPQLLLNWRRRSTEGVSLLFFLFACIGNLTYVLSIFAYSPICHGRHGHCKLGEAEELYGRYILVNLSWLLGSLGTLFLDLAIFWQFIMYRPKNGDEDEDDEVEG